MAWHLVPRKIPKLGFEGQIRKPLGGGQRGWDGGGEDRACRGKSIVRAKQAHHMANMYVQSGWPDWKGRGERT